MQATESVPRFSPFALSRQARWFLAAPVTVLVLVILTLAVTVSAYQSEHNGRIFTGVHVWGVDLSGMTPEAAETKLAGALPYTESQAIVLVDPGSGREWSRSLAELGLTVDVAATADAAYDYGRSGLVALPDQFAGWYYGETLAPVLVLDEGRLNAALEAIAAEINRPARNASLDFDGTTVDYTPGRVGRHLDIPDARQRLADPLTSLRHARIELLVHEVQPQVLDDPDTVTRIQSMVASPMTLYFQEPLADLDLVQVEVSREQLADWLRVEMVEGEDGTSYYNVFMDENAVRHWLSEIETQIYKAPENARFYFDDNTRELVLVEPHVNGRVLDVDATLARFMEQVGTPDRAMPFVVDDLTPTVHAGATAAELGITELITQSTTWFYGSSPERKHNIARAADQFFGIVVAPGEEFSFNKYLGDVTEEAGFTTGLIILGGRTVEGVGGGVCQVSTTLYQTAFWSGFPITERLEHGYRVHYYDDGEGPGMDATVFSPLVDLKFVNNTPHHLLIENYYNATYESLTFKFYSTSMGRSVDKGGPVYENVVPPKPDVWEFNPELEEGEIKQVDWAVEGADVTVTREVYDGNGNLMYGTEAFVSNYIPWQNVYQFGPGADIPEDANVVYPGE